MAARRNLGSNNLDDFFYAVYCGEPEETAKVMGSAISTNFRNSKSQTLFHKAVKDKNAKKIRQFASSGFSPNLMNRDGDTPLHLAIRNNSTSMVSELLAVGADKDAPCLTCTGEPLSALQLAVLYSELDMVRLLVEEGADMDNPCALYTAIVEDNLELAELLLSLGAHVDTMSRNGITPIAQAVLQQNPELVELLLEYKPTLNLGSYHLPLLTFAAQAPTMVRGEMYEQLLSHGADPDCRSSMKALTGAAIPGSCLVPSCSNADNSRVNCLRWLLEYNCSLIWKPGDHLHWDDRGNALDNMHDSPLYFALKKHNDVETVMLFQAGLDHTRLKWPTRHWLVLRQVEQTSLGAFLRKQTESPRTLKDLCRNTIREGLGCGIHEKIRALPLPTALNKYILLKGVFE